MIDGIKGNVYVEGMVVLMEPPPYRNKELYPEFYMSPVSCP